MTWLERAIEAIDDYRTAVGCEPKRVLTTPVIWRQIADDMSDGLLDPHKTRRISIDGVQIIKARNAPPDTLYCDAQEPYE